jgi:hypothetical protein
MKNIEYFSLFSFAFFLVQYVRGRATEYLKKAVLKNNLAKTLLILMCQHRNDLLYPNGSDGYSAVKRGLLMNSRMYDMCTMGLRQFIMFLHSCLPKTGEYAAVVAPVKDLILSYKLDPASAFFICRAAIDSKLALSLPTDNESANEWHPLSDVMVEVVRSSISAPVW